LSVIVDENVPYLAVNCEQSLVRCERSSCFGIVLNAGVDIDVVRKEYICCRNATSSMGVESSIGEMVGMHLTGEIAAFCRNTR
jgi:hypothetical protein